MTHNMGQWDRPKRCLFAGKHKWFYLQDIYCLLAGRQIEVMPTGPHGGTQLPREQHLKSQGCQSHTSYQTEEDRSPTLQKTPFTWARSNRAWKTFDTESHDWRVGGQRKSALNSHWLSTWLRHINVLHIVWKPPLSSALKNKSYLLLLNCSELIISSYQKQRNKWCTFLCIRSAKYHQTDVGVEMLFVRCTSWLCCPSNARYLSVFIKVMYVTGWKQKCDVWRQKQAWNTGVDFDTASELGFLGKWEGRLMGLK